MTTNAERQEKIKALRHKLKEDIAELEKQCAKEIAALEREIKEHQANELKEARLRVQQLLAESGFSAAEVFAGFANPATKQPRKSPRPPEKHYVGPEGQIWTGRGPKPKWLKEAHAAGHQVKVVDANAH
jgi:DNA-binding protein H-NS